MNRRWTSIVFLFLFSCKTITSSDVAEVNLDKFPGDHECMTPPEKGREFEADETFKRILENLGHDSYHTRQKGQRELHDFLLNNNQNGRARYLITQAIENSSDLEVSFVLKNSLTVCEHASITSVDRCENPRASSEMYLNAPDPQSSELELIDSDSPIVDQVVVYVNLDYSNQDFDLFGTSGQSCREVAENTLAKYEHLHRATLRKFNNEIASFEIQFLPAQETLVSPKNCCRAGNKIILNPPKPAPSTGGYTTLVPMTRTTTYFSPTVRLVDSVKNSLVGFEKLCQAVGGKVLVADRNKNEGIFGAYDEALFRGIINANAHMLLTGPAGDENEAGKQLPMSKELGCFNKDSTAKVAVDPPV